MSTVLSIFGVHHQFTVLGLIKACYVRTPVSLGISLLGGSWKRLGTEVDDASKAIPACSRCLVLLSSIH